MPMFEFSIVKDMTENIYGKGVVNMYVSYKKEDNINGFPVDDEVLIDPPLNFHPDSVISDVDIMKEDLDT